MRAPIVPAVVVAALLAVTPSIAHAQRAPLTDGVRFVTSDSGTAPSSLKVAGASRPAVRFAGSDSIANGLAIGGVLGAVGGFIVAPYLFCGNGFDDTECTTIVRVVIGLPILAGGLVAGGLIDKYHVRGPVIWKDARGRAIARAGTFPQGGHGLQMVMRF